MRTQKTTPLSNLLGDDGKKTRSTKSKPRAQCSDCGKCKDDCGCNCECGRGDCDRCKRTKCEVRCVNLFAAAAFLDPDTVLPITVQDPAASLGTAPTFNQLVESDRIVISQNNVTVLRDGFYSFTINAFFIQNPDVDTLVANTTVSIAQVFATLNAAGSDPSTVIDASIGTVQLNRADTLPGFGEVATQFEAKLKKYDVVGFWASSIDTIPPFVFTGVNAFTQAYFKSATGVVAQPWYTVAITSLADRK